jgi:hypothetical protein
VQLVAPILVLLQKKEHQLKNNQALLEMVKEKQQNFFPLSLLLDIAMNKLYLENVK